MEEKNLCSYGCGREAIIKFRNGKYCCETSKNKCPALRELNRKGNTGRIQQQEVRDKIGEWNRNNKKRTKPSPIKNEENFLCSYGCGNIATHQYLNGKLCCCDSHYRCREQRRKNKERLVDQFKDPIRKEQQSISTKKSWEDPERKNKNTIGLKKFYDNETAEERDIRKKRSKESHNTKEYKELMVIRAKEFWNREEYIKNHDIAMQKLFEDPKYRIKISERLIKFNKNHPGFFAGENNGMYGKIHKPESIKIMSLKGKIRWADPEYVKRIQKSFNIKPNKPETLLVNLFKDLNLDYEYTGDFSFWISGKNPDFTNYKDKKVIEFFGIYWHGEKFRNDGNSNIIHEQQRIEHFAKEGYKCLIIWEDELKDLDKLIEKILKFDME
jgi:G:T-mismatch repair DNA endonuclease (very short patch repair protein)